MFACGVLLYILVHFHRNCIPGQIYNDLSIDLNLNASQMAAIGASVMYTYAFMQLANGILVDKFGGCRVLLCGGVLTVTGSWIFISTSQFWGLIASRILIGLGVGSTYLSMLDITKWRFPKTFSAMTGFFLAVGQIGGAVGTAPFAACCQSFGWETCLKVITIFTTVAAIFMALCFCMVDKQKVSKNPMRLRSFLTVIFNKYNIYHNLTSNFAYGVFYAFFTLISKKFLQDCYGMSSEGASTVCCAMLIMQAVFNQTFGILVAKFKTRAKAMYNGVVLTSFISCVLILILVALDCSVCKPLVIVLLNTFGIVAGYTPVSLELTRNLNPQSMSSCAIGFNNCAAYLFTAIFTFMTGFTLDCFAPQAGTDTYSPKAYMTLLAVNAALLLIPVIISRIIPDHHGENIYQESWQCRGIGKP